MESKRVFFMAHLCCVREMNMKQKTMKYWYIFRMKSRVEKGAWSFFCSWRSRYVSCGFFCVFFFLGGYIEDSVISIFDVVPLFQLLNVRLWDWRFDIFVGEWYRSREGWGNERNERTQIWAFMSRWNIPTKLLVKLNHQVETLCVYSILYMHIIIIIYFIHVCAITMNIHELFALLTGILDSAQATSERQRCWDHGVCHHGRHGSWEDEGGVDLLAYYQLSW